MVKIKLLALCLLSLLFLNCSESSTDPNNNPREGGGEGLIYYTNTGYGISRVNVQSNAVEKLMEMGQQVDFQHDQMILIESVNGRMVETDLTGANKRSIIEYSSAQAHLDGFNAARLSPDGKYIAYNDGYSLSVVYVIDAQTGALVTRIGDKSTSDYTFTPTWTPDGALIVAGLQSGNGFYLVDKTFSTIQRITDASLTNISAPSVSPDGSKIAFIRDAKVWYMNIDGSGATQLNTGISDPYTPVWSPDSKLIAVNNDRPSIYILDPEKATVRELTVASPQRGFQMSWK